MRFWAVILRVNVALQPRKPAAETPPVWRQKEDDHPEAFSTYPDQKAKTLHQGIVFYDPGPCRIGDFTHEFDW
jgi:hypothetical protein